MDAGDRIQDPGRSKASNTGNGWRARGPGLLYTESPTGPISPQEKAGAVLHGKGTSSGSQLPRQFHLQEQHQMVNTPGAQGADNGFLSLVVKGSTMPSPPGSCLTTRDLPHASRVLRGPPHAPGSFTLHWPTLLTAAISRMSGNVPREWEGRWGKRELPGRAEELTWTNL